jgi:2-methylisocitrate lyase-like PEP mutase family enzyme
MSSQAAKTTRFQSLHVPGQPLVLFNIWDPGSALAVAASGAQALATGSWSVAKALGYDDGEKLPLALAIANLQRIVQCSELPVTVDLESGYSADADGVGKTIAMAIAAGAVGCNLEDSHPTDGTLRDMADQVKRIESARASAKAAGLDFFINARCDVFFQVGSASHNMELVDQAIMRAQAYGEAGASGLFLPGLLDANLIAETVRRSPLPLNIMFGGDSLTRKQLSELGVARISHGPGPYRLMMKQLQDAATMALI